MNSATEKPFLTPFYQVFIHQFTCGAFIVSEDYMTQASMQVRLGKEYQKTII